MPLTLMVVVVGVVWSWLLYEPYFGLINLTLQRVGAGFLTQMWLGDPDLAIFSLILINIWMWTGWSMVLYLAGLQGIPKDLYEVAKLDGANSWQRLRYITFPLLSHVHFTLLVLGVIGTLQTFDIIYITTRGGPYHSTEVLATELFRQGFILNHYGYASAVGVVLFLIALALTILQFRLYYRKKG